MKINLLRSALISPILRNLSLKYWRLPIFILIPLMKVNGMFSHSASRSVSRIQEYFWARQETVFIIFGRGLFSLPAALCNTPDLNRNVVDPLDRSREGGYKGGKWTRETVVCWNLHHSTTQISQTSDGERKEAVLGWTGRTPVINHVAPAETLCWNGVD